MDNKQRILTNTIILYFKIVVCTVLSLWTVPLALSALGQADYGLFNLIAGVLAMLAFLNASMAGATQRYLSVTKGTDNIEKLNAVFNSSVFLHAFLASFLLVMFEISALFLFDGVFNIEPSRIEAAKVLYHILVLSTVITVISVPYDAILFAHENMLLVSLISIFDALLKLCIVLILPFVSSDKLIVYGIGICLISVLNFLVKYVYIKFKQSFYRVHKHLFDKVLFKEMFSYAIFNSLGSFAVIGRNQGVAVVINFFCGTVVNAAYGIANQINSVLLSFSSSIQTAMSPQLMQKEGAKDRLGMLSMSYVLTKLGVTIFSLAAIPIIIELPYILRLWLTNVPDCTIIFTRFILVFQLLSQFSTGAAISIDAVGKIRVYRTIISSVLILNIPIVFVLLKVGVSVDYTLITFSVVEVSCLVIRLNFAKKLSEFDLLIFFKEILLPFLIIFICIFVISLCYKRYIGEGAVRLILTVITSTSAILILTYSFVLNNSERQLTRNLVKRIS